MFLNYGFTFLLWVLGESDGA